MTVTTLTLPTSAVLLKSITADLAPTGSENPVEDFKAIAYAATIPTPVAPVESDSVKESDAIETAIAIAEGAVDTYDYVTTQARITLSIARSSWIILNSLCIALFGIGIKESALRIFDRSTVFIINSLYRSTEVAIKFIDWTQSPSARFFIATAKEDTDRMVKFLVWAIESALCCQQ